jgi:hypothetical protein
VTFKTDNRKTWGRFYIPGYTTTAMDGTHHGAISTTYVDELCTAAKALTDRSGPGNHPTLCVWSNKGRTHHDPQQVQVDDVWDIQRRRRFKHATYKKVLTAG